MFFLSWLLYPLLLAMLGVGCGMLVERVAGEVSRVLLLPVGFALLLVVVAAFTYFDRTAELAAPAAAVVALVGIVLGARAGRLPRPSRTWLWPAVAAGGGYLAIAAPVLLTGHVGFTGYARIVDITNQLAVAERMITTGGLVASGYPTGAQATHGATSWLLGIDPIWTWQPLLAMFGAVLGLSLYALLTPAITWAPTRALAAAVAAQPTILYAYTLNAGIKEMAAAALLALLAGLLVAGRHESGGVRGFVPLLVALGAGLAVFNVGFLPWAAVLLALALAPRMRGLRGWRPTRRAVIASVVVVIVVAVPLVPAAIELAPLLRNGGPTGVGDAYELGNLASPVGSWATLGPWLTGDHRFPLALAGKETLTEIFAVVVAAFVVLGVAGALRRRDWTLLSFAVAGAVGFGVVTWQGTEWVDLKAMCVTAPIALAVAFAGTSLLRRWGGLAATLVIAVGVLWGNALQYEHTTLAPSARFQDLKDIADRYRADDPTIFITSWEEYASYLMSGVNTTTPYTTPVPEAWLRIGVARPGMLFTRDFDEIALGFLESYDTLIARRDPSASRPPSDFRLVERTHFYDIWRKDERRWRPWRHYSLGGDFLQVREPDTCEDLRLDLLISEPGARIAYALPQSGVTRPLQPPPRLWSHGLLARGPGKPSAIYIADRPGRYDIRLGGSFGRRVKVAVDGREVGSVRWREAYPGQLEPVGEVTLRKGFNRIDVIRGSGSLLPGTGNDLAPDDGLTTRTGPLAIAPADERPQSVHTVSIAEGLRLCDSGAPLDWLEIVKRRRP